MYRSALSALALSCAPASVCTADIIAVDQERYVRAVATVAPGGGPALIDEHRIDAVDASPFFETIGASYGPAEGGVYSSASALQNSGITPDAVSFTASAFSNGAVYQPFDQSVAGGFSFARFYFDVAAPTAVRFDISAVRTPGPSSVYIVLVPVDGGANLTDFQLFQLTGEYHEELSLPAGRYQFYAEVSAATGIYGTDATGYFFDSTSVQVNAVLSVVPAPAAAATLGLAMLLCTARRRPRASPSSAA